MGKTGPGMLESKRDLRHSDSGRGTGMRAGRTRRIAPLSMGIALALGAGAAHGAMAKFAGLPRHDGAIVLRQQLHELMPPVAKTATSPAALLPVTSCADDGGAGTLRTVVAAAGEGDTV